MAHAIHGYSGKCKDIHGHSYELHVTVANSNKDNFQEAPGFIMDFKELKSIVEEHIISKVDHKLMLSENFIENNKSCLLFQNLISVKFEPSAENLLLYFYKQIVNSFPPNIQLVKMRIYETRDSYAEWIA